jgi:hypothetical protein
MLIVDDVCGQTNSTLKRFFLVCCQLQPTRGRAGLRDAIAGVFLGFSGWSDGCLAGWTGGESCVKRRID